MFQLNKQYCHYFTKRLYIVKAFSKSMVLASLRADVSYFLASRGNGSARRLGIVIVLKNLIYSKCVCKVLKQRMKRKSSKLIVARDPKSSIELDLRNYFPLSKIFPLIYVTPVNQWNTVIFTMVTYVAWKPVKNLTTYGKRCVVQLKLKSAFRPNLSFQKPHAVMKNTTSRLFKTKVKYTIKFIWINAFVYLEIEIAKFANVGCP